jgi:hypothetical protein
MPGPNRWTRPWRQPKARLQCRDTSPDSAAGAVRKMVLPVANRAFSSPSVQSSNANAVRTKTG